MAESSTAAAVSARREAASIFPLVPNEISITNTRLCRYGRRFLENAGAGAARLRRGWNACARAAQVMKGKKSIFFLRRLSGSAQSARARMRSTELNLAAPVVVDSLLAGNSFAIYEKNEMKGARAVSCFSLLSCGDIFGCHAVIGGVQFEPWH